MKTTIYLLLTIVSSALAQTPSGAGSAIGSAQNGMNGGPIDPTKNVLDLVNAAIKREDDLRDMEMKYTKEISELRAGHEKELRVSEAARLDSIRQVDREDVAKTNATTKAATEVLAKQTLDLSNTLAKQVTEAAAAIETRFSAFQTETNKRLAAIETQSAERTGKTAVADPELLASNKRQDELLEKLAATQAATSGSSEGQRTLINVMIAFGVLVLAFLGFIYRKSSQNGKLLRTGK